MAAAESVPVPPLLFLALGPAFVRPTQLESPTIARIIARVRSPANGRRVEEVEEIDRLPQSAEIGAKAV